MAQASLCLAAGRTLLDGVVQALAPMGCASAVLNLHGGALHPFVHVLPATSPSPEHAVFYSERHAAPAPVSLLQATATFGLMDGKPWLHCHATWTDAQGRLHCGHVLPDACIIHAPVQASAQMLSGACFVVKADEETRFSLFRPEPSGRCDPSHQPAWALRLAPNEDVCTAIESVCASRGIQRARILGGVGSTVGAVFDDGRVVEPFITELLVHRAEVAPGPDGRPRAGVEVSLVDHHGGISRGTLARGANPVLVTFELVLAQAA